MSNKTRRSTIPWAIAMFLICTAIAIQSQGHAPRTRATGNPTQTIAPASTPLQTAVNTPAREMTETWGTPTVATPEVTPLPTATP